MWTIRLAGPCVLSAFSVASRPTKSLASGKILLRAWTSCAIEGACASSIPKIRELPVEFACFKWQSQQASYDWFNRYRPNYHSLHVLGGYGHLDIFIGTNAVRDTYPVMLAELERPN